MGLPALDSDSYQIQIRRDLRHSEASSIYEIQLHGERYAMKVFHDNGDEGFTEKGRDLNRFRCEVNAYSHLLSYGVCDSGVVPYCYGYIDRLNPAFFSPHLNHFASDKFHPQAIILEFLADTESLNCVNYSIDRFVGVLRGIQEIHRALVLHFDVYPKNILIVPGEPERVVWIDFDVAKTFSAMEDMTPKDRYLFEDEKLLAASLGDLFERDQKEGLPPNTKYY
ncbi:uncharacterized protein N7459_007092 [Penicillium hispanicum]|uniref:uncharacterized protein n=1 Tax=Penicillium hispanicum TaxID=1080232 RepID=UPI0025408BC3|nr:uncharacterized protein N7459_007092 [Penicillium hispanicum]KAJ5578128.1 hypothetical protein N7459_007092 [Penicillium hispanicum]